MRIGLVCKSLDRSRGGHERYVNRLIRGLNDRDHQIIVYTGDSTVPKELLSSSVEVVDVPRIPLGGAIRRLSFNAFAKSLVEKHRADLDVVFTTGKVDFGDVHRTGGGVHEVYLEQCESYLRRWLPKNLVSCWLERRLYESDIERIIVNSHMVKNQILNCFDTPSDRISVIYNGIDTDQYDWHALRSVRSDVRQKHGFDDSDFVCLFTGGSWRRKGLPHLLHALALVDDRHVKLIVTGHVDEQKLTRSAQQLDIADRVKFVGFTEQLHHEYAAADAFVFPSRYDAAANVVIESLACGTPVVTTATNGSSELVEEEETGYVVDRADQEDEIAESIRKLRDVDDREALRERAHKTGSRYTMKRHIDRVETVITNL